ncbi:MAG TPA: hypothetical protein DIT07_16670 [Sphingobacteriaceae bacterium]|nr:hypothetical protein [Sphingobacteriaceae bacterium]
MPFIRDLKRTILIEIKKELLKKEMVTQKPVPVRPLLNLSRQFMNDLNLPFDTDIDKIEEDLLKWYLYMFHKGIAVAIAARFGRDHIVLDYLFENARNGNVPSYEISILPIKGEYSFNLRYHLSGNEWILQELFDSIYNYIKIHKQIIKQEHIDINELIGEFLSFAGISGIEFINRIDLTKDDYWPIRNSIIIKDERIKDDSDLEETDQLGSFEEPVLENKESIRVRCSFCGKPALILPKGGDIWNEAILDPCEHFAFAFITNTNNHLYGREYYRNFFKKSVIDYVETFKGFTCQANPEAFINDFLNGDTDLNKHDLTTIIKILKSTMPDCDIQIKEFSKILNGEKHVFVFHFMKFVLND